MHADRHTKIEKRKNIFAKGPKVVECSIVVSLYLSMAHDSLNYINMGTIRQCEATGGQTPVVCG